MLLLALLNAGLAAPPTPVSICIYDTSASSCPHEATLHYSIHNWNEYRTHEQDGFGVRDSTVLTYYLLADLSPSTPIELHLSSLGTHNVTFRPVGDGRRIVFLDYSTTTQARYFRFYNCFVSVMHEGALYFYNLFLENSMFLEPALRLWAYETLVVDLYSASALPSLSASSIRLNFEKAFWPLGTEVIRLSRIVTINNFSIGGVDHQLSMRIFGDMLLFQRPGYGSIVYVDVQECITAPQIYLDRDGGQLTVFCDYWVQKYYDPPILEFRLSTNEPLIFGDSSWPFWFPNFVLVTTSGRHGQNFWVRTPFMPVAVKSYWNISETYEPIGDPTHQDQYLTELTIGLDVAEATILGQIQTQACDLHFDTRVIDRPALLTINDFLEYGMELAEDHHLDKGVFPHIKKSNMRVRFLIHEKHESVNSSSKFGGDGTWEWINFPYTQGHTGVGHLRVNSSHLYDIFYGHRWSGGYGSALSELDPHVDGASSIVFSDPAVPRIQLRPNYYFTEETRPSNDWLDLNWPVGKDPSQPTGYPALFYFHDANIPDQARVDIVLPEYGAPGFEQSTFFFDFVWEESHRIVRMVKRDKHVRDYNYRFCWNPYERANACPPDYAVITHTDDVSKYVLRNAKQLRFALAADLAFDFAYFNNRQINIRIFTPNASQLRTLPNLTVPASFLTGSKFGEIHLHNLTLRFDRVSNPKVELNETVHLDLHNVQIDKTVTDSLEPNGCRDTPYIEADPLSYSRIHDHCVPDTLFLDEGIYHRIVFAQDQMTLYSPLYTTLTIRAEFGRPRQIEILYHQNELELDVEGHPSRIPNVHIWLPTLPGLPNISFGNAWTDQIAGNLTIDNLIGYFYVRTPFIPFRPGGAVRIAETGQQGIRIHAADGLSYPDGVTVYYPFPSYARINPDGYGVTLRFQNVHIATPMSPTGNIERAIFAGDVSFDQGAGMHVMELEFDKNNRPTLKIDFRLQGGLPRLYLGSIHSPMDQPYSINFIHRGASERDFIRRHPDWFRQFSHEVICGNASMRCEHWTVFWEKNSTEDHTSDHEGSNSILRAVCRPQKQGILGMCLALEVEEYYFPLPTFSPWQSPPPWPTASHVHTAHPGGDASQGGYTANSGIGKGVGIGIAVGVVFIAAAVFLAYKFFGPNSHSDYKVADLP